MEQCNRDDGIVERWNRDGGTEEQRWRKSRPSDGGTVEHLMLEQWKRDGEAVEHLMVE